MKKVELGKTGLKVTPVGFGVLTVGPWQMNLPVREGAAVLRYALEAGINFLDTAQYYKTYPVIREALRGFGGANDLVIASKSLVSSYDDMKGAIEEARRAMDRDVIEIFLLHEIRGEQDFQDRAGAWEYLQEAKSRGLVKRIGVSTHHVDVAQAVAGLPVLQDDAAVLPQGQETVRPHRSLMADSDILFPLINFRGMGIRHGDAAGRKEDMAAAIKAAADAGKGVFAMKVFGGGNLSGSYREAVGYVKNLPGVHALMMGFGYSHEVDRAIEIMEDRLPADYEPDISHKKIRIDQGDCMCCRKCVKRCPNHAIYITDQGTADVDHTRCLTCGYCAPVCEYMAIILY